MRPDDEAALQRFLEDLDLSARMFRFFSAAVDLRAAARWAADVDYEHRYGVVAVAPDGTVLAHGCYGGDDRPEAEVAFAVAERLRGEGVATTMLAHLAQAARESGIPTFTAEVLPSNHRMIEVFRESGLAPVVFARSGVLHVEMPTTLTDDAWRLYDERDAIAAAAAVSHVLRPASIAVFGASERAGSVGGAIFGNLLAGGYTGELHPINPRGGTVAGRPAARSLDDLDAEIELGVIAVPAGAVLDAARSCAEHGVRALVVITAGFAEAGEDGRRRQHDLVELCRGAGMRLVGPNCLGVMNTDPEIRMNASFSPSQPPPGRVGFLSQSGALGIAVVEAARGLGMGLSSFVSVGNKGDLSGNDFLSYWERDPGTDVALLYLESFGNPRRFARIARRVARRKPIVAVKGGRTAAGLKAAGSHTGALLSASDAAVEALFEQAGVIRTDTLSELFDVAALLAAQPPPAGPRVGIVTNGGGLGILCADACAGAGLEVAELEPALQRELRDLLGPHSAVGNPVDMLAAASPEQFERTIAALGASGSVDAIIALYVPPQVSDPAEIASAVRRGADAIAVPVATVFAMADPPAAALAGADGRRLPLYRFPEEATRALGRAARYGRWRATPEGTVPRFDVDTGAASAVLARALTRGPGWLEPTEASALLDHYGIPRPPELHAAGATGAQRAAAQLGGPVALKAVAPGLVHRSDARAVVVGLDDPAVVAREARAMSRRLRSQGLEAAGFLVQRMADPGIEMLVGVVVDPTFGPVVACAAGGTATELLGDSAVRLAPLTDTDARTMVRSLRTFPLLDGFRGAPRADVAALEEVLLRLAALADAHHEVAEIECNPLIVGPKGAVAVDVRVRVEPAEPTRPEPSMRAF